ncbi:hypothetical protein [Streptomyces sp. NPDC088350]|uniref:hypothetical protein n=1 Tax=Streptomyces sp. NPDC088350 TaxID=3365854 RepID=UPI003824B134
MRIKAKKKTVRRVVAAFVGLAAVGACVAVLVAGGDDGPRAVSAGEAQRMALARFRTYRASPSAVTLRAVTPGGTTVIHAVVDHRTHRAVGTYEVAGAGNDGRGVLAWDLGGVAVARGRRAGVAAGGAGIGAGALRRAVRGVGEREWVRRGFSGDPLDIALRLTTSMAADRPDNAQLLAQSGPLWLRDDRIDGRSYGVFTGPRPRPQGAGRPTAPSASGRSPLTYWIDADGDLRRLTADLGPGRTVQVDVTAGHVPGKLPDGPWKRRSGSAGADRDRGR